MRRISVLPVLLVMALFVTSCFSPAPTAPAAPAAAPTQAPTAAPTQTPVAVPTQAPAVEQDIVDTAIADGRFTTLVTAVQAAGLVETLKGEGPFTVFAPTDEAFGMLPEGTVDGLLKDPAALKDILLYHVVAGNVMAADAAELTSAPTVQGTPIAIKAENGKVMINDATVVIADIKTSNGVIHVIDKVLLPAAE